jgi:flagellar motor switch protein FliN/FliY
MSTETAAIAEDFAAIFATNARNVLKTAVGRPCQCNVSPGEDPVSALPEDGLLRLRIAFSGALEGSLSLLLTQADGAMLADLLMMGDGTAAWNDEQLDALKEIGNQLAGSLATNLGERWSAHVGNAGASCEPWTKGDAAGTLLAFSLQIQGGGDNPAVLWLEEPLVQSLIKQDEARSSLAAVSEALAGLDLGTTPSAPVTPTETASLPKAEPPPQPPVGSGNWLDSNDPALARLLDVPIEVHIELGKTELAIRRVLEIGPGSIIELDRTAGEPVDLVVNERVVARGEVVVVDENFGIRITQLVSPEERIRQLR